MFKTGNPEADDNQLVVPSCCSTTSFTSHRRCKVSICSTPPQQSMADMQLVTEQQSCATKVCNMLIICHQPDRSSYQCSYSNLFNLKILYRLTSLTFVPTNINETFNVSPCYIIERSAVNSSGFTLGLGIEQAL